LTELGGFRPVGVAYLLPLHSTSFLFFVKFFPRSGTVNRYFSRLRQGICFGWRPELGCRSARHFCFFDGLPRFLVDFSRASRSDPRQTSLQCEMSEERPWTAPPSLFTGSFVCVSAQWSSMTTDCALRPLQSFPFDQGYLLCLVYCTPV